MILVPDNNQFSYPRLAALYDTLNAWGAEGEFFCRRVAEVSASSIIDLGCGTGSLTCELAKRGHHMVGIEPSEAMLAVARSKPHAEHVTWIEGSYEKFEGLRTDIVLMTSHVAQFFLEDEDWEAMLKAAHKVLNPNGHLVFDIRRIANPPFAGWPTENNRRRFENTVAGPVEWWFELLEVKDRRVRYELHYFFVRSGEEVVSMNELIFRSQAEIARSLSDASFSVEQVYGDWDGSPAGETSPEMIFVAMKDTLSA